MNADERFALDRLPRNIAFATNPLSNGIALYLGSRVMRMM